MIIYEIWRARQVVGEEIVFYMTGFPEHPDDKWIIVEYDEKKDLRKFPHGPNVGYEEHEKALRQAQRIADAQGTRAEGWDIVQEKLALNF